MMQRFGVCVVGLGWMGRVHAEAFASVREKVALFVCSRDKGRGQEFATRYGAEGWFTDYDEVLRDERIQVIDLCLPHDLHFPRALEAFEAGKHVLVEKPMARNLREAREMVQTARAKGKRLAVAENIRVYPQCIEAQRLLSDGALGEPFFLQVNHFAYYTPKGWRQSLERAGGGALIDTGHHYVDLAVMLGGRVKKVIASISRKTITEIEGEDTAVIHLWYERGVIGQVTVSFGMPGVPSAPLFLVCGTEGSLVYERKGKGLVWYRKRGEPKVLLPADLPESQWEETIRRGVRAFVDGFLRGKEAPLGAEGAFHDMAIITASYESARKGMPVSVPYL